MTYSIEPFAHVKQNQRHSFTGIHGAQDAISRSEQCGLGRGMTTEPMLESLKKCPVTITVRLLLISAYVTHTS